MSMTASPAWRRALAFAGRAWVQQGRTTVWLTAIAGGGLGVLVFLGSDSMRALTTMPGLIPAEPGGPVSARDAAGMFLPMTSYLLTMTPAILGMLVATVATLTLPGVVADDTTGGGIEALLAGPIPRRHLFSAYLGASLLLAATAWAVSLLTFVVFASVTALVTQVSTSISLGYGAAMLVVPISMGLWSATATLFGALLHPGSLETRAGLNGGPIRLVAILPTALAVPAVSLLSDWVLPALGLVLTVTLLASLVLIRATARGFRSARVLGS